jgi:hypothetical protein
MNGFVMKSWYYLSAGVSIEPISRCGTFVMTDEAAAQSIKHEDAP